jgi:hypothetical protein
LFKLGIPNVPFPDMGRLFSSSSSNIPIGKLGILSSKELEKTKSEINESTVVTYYRFK